MGYLVYRGSTQGLPSIETTPGVADNNAYQILPYGKDLDFQKVEDYNKNKILFPYPKVSPSEIGASSTSMME
jgi:5-methylcytosine-specific restriction endonuclease McrBC regulatory subunit McrC